MLFFVFAILAIAFVLALAAPLIGARARAAPREERSTTLTARLEAIERAAAAGLIGETQAGEARLEAQRAALDAAAAPSVVSGGRSLRLAAVGLALAAPLAAVWIYAAIGSPDYRRLAAEAPAPSSAETIAALPPEEREAMIENMVAGLAARLEGNPRDIEGWRMLARSYGVMGRPERAAEAWRRLLDLTEGDIEDWRAYAATLIELGPSGEGALAGAFEKIEALNPDDPLLLYYSGLSARDAGDDARAAGYWRRLLSVLPPDSPVAPAIRDLLAEAESERGKE